MTCMSSVLQSMNGGQERPFAYQQGSCLARFNAWGSGNEIGSGQHRQPSAIPRLVLRRAVCVVNSTKLTNVVLPDDSSMVIASTFANISKRRLSESLAH